MPSEAPHRSGSAVAFVLLLASAPIWLGCGEGAPGQRPPGTVSESGSGETGEETGQTGEETGQRPPGAAPAASSATMVFRDAAVESGLVFTYFNGMSGRSYLPEVMGAGVALLDYDDDGDLDVYFAQGHLLGEGVDPGEATFPPPPDSPPGDRLFRNDLAPGEDGSPRLRFVDVTRASGLRAFGYAMGVATGDFDNDGWTDIYVTNFGANQLWRNNGDGTFSDVTAGSGTGDELYGSSAAFLDFDLDGHLDLVAGNYVDFRLSNHKTCFAASGLPDFCGPTAYGPEPNRLFRNRGDGTFEDVSAASGLGRTRGRTLGVVVDDFDGDFRPDIYFANDADENELWRNAGDGTFEEVALLAGVAVNMEGQPEAGMGADSGDFDNDGDNDLILTHLKTETNTLYVNDGQGDFTDETMATGLGAASWNFTGFGASWLDYDNDGWLDLLAVNGEVRIDAVLAQRGDPFPLDQPNLLFHNRGDGSFEEVSQEVGEVLTRPLVSRGAAFGDLDNDGDTDVVVLNNCDPAQLLLNLSGERRHWSGVRLRDGEPPRDLLGSRVRWVRPGTFDLHRRVRSDGSYLSANDPRVLVGLGDSPVLGAVCAERPGGRRQCWEAPPAARYLTLGALGTAR